MLTAVDCITLLLDSPALLRLVAIILTQRSFDSGPAEMTVEKFLKFRLKTIIQSTLTFLLYVLYERFPLIFKLYVTYKPKIFFYSMKNRKYGNSTRYNFYVSYDFFLHTYFDSIRTLCIQYYKLETGKIGNDMLSLKSCVPHLSAKLDKRFYTQNISSRCTSSLCSRENLDFGFLPFPLLTFSVKMTN